MSLSDCVSDGSLITLEVLQFILLSFTCVWASNVVYPFTCGLAETDKVDKVLKIICIAAEIFCIISITALSILIYLSSQQCPYTGEFTNLMNVVGPIAILTYALALICLYLIFWYRLDRAFIKSVYKLSRVNQYILTAVFALQIILILVGVTAFVFVLEAGLSIMGAAAMVAIFSTILLLRVFIKKLKQVSRAVSGPDLRADQMQLVRYMTRLSCLMLAVLITGAISVLGILVTAAMSDSWAIAVMSMQLTSFDMAANAFCLYLQWPFSQTVYKCVCSPCDACVLKKCAQDVGHSVGVAQASESKLNKLASKPDVAADAADALDIKSKDSSGNGPDTPRTLNSSTHVTSMSVDS